jgi:hypothetical protein
MVAQIVNHELRHVVDNGRPVRDKAGVECERVHYSELRFDHSKIQTYDQKHDSWHGHSLGIQAV